MAIFDITFSVPEATFAASDAACAAVTPTDMYASIISHDPADSAVGVVPGDRRK